jgi:hypothetical protein
MHGARIEARIEKHPGITQGFSWLILKVTFIELELLEL